MYEKILKKLFSFEIRFKEIFIADYQMKQLILHVLYIII